MSRALNNLYSTLYSQWWTFYIIYALLLVITKVKGWWTYNGRIRKNKISKIHQKNKHCTHKLFISYLLFLTKIHNCFQDEINYFIVSVWSDFYLFFHSVLCWFERVLFHFFPDSCDSISVRILYTLNDIFFNCECNLNINNYCWVYYTRSAIHVFQCNGMLHI